MGFQSVDFLQWHSVESLITAVVLPFTALQTQFLKVEEGYLVFIKIATFLKSSEAVFLQGTFASEWVFMVISGLY